MAIPITQWEAVGGVAHAWIAQCEGYVSLCGREVSGLHGQRSGIRCAQCATSSGWAEATSQSSYLMPHRQPMMDDPPSFVHHTAIVLGQPPIEEVIQADTDVPVSTKIIQDAQVSSILVVPDSLEAYEQLPMVEQRYWAPVMLARTGQEAIWDHGQETAEQFQQRCYEQLRTGAE